jgi:hypothetical protein
VDARDLGRPLDFLTQEEMEALGILYDTGKLRGGEFVLPGRHNVTVQGCFWIFDKLDTTYFGDFWSQPGYEGYEGVAGPVVEGLKGSVTALGYQDSSGNTIGFSASQDFGNIKGYTAQFTSGALAGKSFHVSSAYGRIIYIDPVRESLNGLAVGDTFTLDNRDFLAWTHWHRHIVDCDSPLDAVFCSSGKPVYVQRPPEAQRAFDAVKLTGNIKKPVVAVLNGLDSPLVKSNYFERVRAALGSQAEGLLRVYWMENAVHSRPYYLTNRVVDPFPAQLLAFIIMDQWVDRGIAPPPETVVSVTPESVTFPDTADERKGIQPAVTATANGLREVTVSAGEKATFNGVATSPIGNVSRYEWDFEGDNQYDITVMLPDPAKEAATPATHTYSSPGTHIATLRVTGDAPYKDYPVELQNLSRVIVHVRQGSMDFHNQSAERR